MNFYLDLKSLYKDQVLVYRLQLRNRPQTQQMYVPSDSGISS